MRGTAETIGLQRALCRALAGALAVFILSLLLSSSIDAARQPAKRKAGVSLSTPLGSGGADVVLLMDASGSMKKTDPENYRISAAKLFVSLLSADDRVSVIRFGDNARILIPLIPNTAANRKNLNSAIRQIGSNDSMTNIYEGVRRGAAELSSSSRKKRILLLMSDGKLDMGSPEKDEAATEALLKMLPELDRSGIRLYTVAFTDLSDKKFLERIARETGGLFKFAKMDKDIHVIFTTIFEKIKAPDAIPLEGEIFTVDQGIDEATLIITKQPRAVITLAAPSARAGSAEKHDKNIQWYADKVFDMITINKPAPGVWRVGLSSTEGNKVFVLTNLRLKTSYDSSVVKTGDSVTIDIWLERDGGVITDGDVLGKIAFSVEVLQPDGTKLKPVLSALSASDRKGAYVAKFLASQPGEHAVKLSAAGSTFKRDRMVHFTAEGAAVSLPLSPAPTPVSAPMAPPALLTASEAGWKKSLAQFGIVNAGLLVTAGIVYGVWRLICRRRRDKGSSLPLSGADGKEVPDAQD